MAKEPQITVIALCYNHESFLVECLESIQNQTYKDYELIVTDDCSRDGSAELISNWLSSNRPEARFIRHEKNVGICSTLNEAIQCSRGKYISMIATDDVWEPFKLERQLARIESTDDETAVVYSDAIRISATGEQLAGDFIESHRPHFEPPSGRIFNALCDDNFIPAMATLVRKKALMTVGLYDERLTHEDYDMWLRLSSIFKFAFEPGAVARYRVLENSLVRTLNRSHTPERSFTDLVIASRMLDIGGLAESQKKRVVNRLWNAAYALYVIDDPRSAFALRTAYRHKGGLRLALLVVASMIGMTRLRLCRLASLLPGRKHH